MDSLRININPNKWIYAMEREGSLGKKERKKERKKRKKENNNKYRERKSELWISKKKN